jgi:hypothetical protein
MGLLGFLLAGCDGWTDESEMKGYAESCREDDSIQPLGTQHLLIRVSAVSKSYWRGQVGWGSMPPKRTPVRTFTDRFLHYTW